MWYHRLINSNERRIARTILYRQMKSRNNWYTELKQYAEINNININEQHITKTTYEQFKTEVKTHIQLKIKNDINKIKKSMTKLRNVNPGKRQLYVEECSMQEVSQIMKIRLNMIRAHGNYGGGKCRKCGTQEETTSKIYLTLAMRFTLLPKINIGFHF